MKIIHNALICNEGKSFRGYIAIKGDRITAVRGGDVPSQTLAIASWSLDAKGKLLVPGAIDDQVHFREPGLTEKGDIATESRAAVAGGVTSFMEMPNTKPATTTLDLLEQKFSRASEVSPANYSFYLGATNKNIDQIQAIDPTKVCGVKVFMGSSTGNMLVDDSDMLSQIFRLSPVLVATHCEDEATVQRNLAKAKAIYGDQIPPSMHPVIRDAEACYVCSARAVELAHKYGTQLHVLHLSTARELSLFDNSRPLVEKRITNEVCVHHLWFTDEAYQTKGNFVKWNPAIKSAADRQALREAVVSGLVDVVATDHAPHTLEQKLQPYLQAPSGGPFVQHSLVAMLDMFSPDVVVQRMAHAPAALYHIEGRGYLREGYYADIALVDSTSWRVTEESLFYKCGWSPITGDTLNHRVTHTFVNGELAYEDGRINDQVRGRRLAFRR